MKKFILTFVFALFCVMNFTANAQFMSAQELETYSKEKYEKKWVDAATNLHNQLTLDKNGSLTYIQVIDCGEKTKEQLYVILNYWVTTSFNDANSVIKLNDKELGTIICQGYVSDIAQHIGGSNTYYVSITPIIKLDIKDNKIRVTYTIQNYDVIKKKAGILDALAGSRTYNNASMIEEKWPIETCYPFVEKDKHKKTSSKALVMTHAYSNIIMDHIEEAVKNGIAGNETDNW